MSAKRIGCATLQYSTVSLSISCLSKTSAIQCSSHKYHNCASAVPMYLQYHCHAAQRHSRIRVLLVTPVIHRVYSTPPAVAAATPVLLTILTTPARSYRFQVVLEHPPDRVRLLGCSHRSYALGTLSIFCLVGPCSMTANAICDGEELVLDTRAPACETPGCGSSLGEGQGKRYGRIRAWIFDLQSTPLPRTPSAMHYAEVGVGGLGAVNSIGH